MSLEALLQRADIWRGRSVSSRPGPQGLATGYPPLDRLLPGAGWPTNALSEILFEEEGIGELQLLMPALAALSRGDRWLAWIGPPHLPYPPALAARGIELSRLLVVEALVGKQRLWALEQALRSGDCSAVLGWLPATVAEAALRRLQLAAEEGETPGFLFRPAQAAAHASPAALRLRLSATPQGLGLEILKCRGGWSRGELLLAPDAVA